jgi:hypothetical protein
MTILVSFNQIQKAIPDCDVKWMRYCSDSADKIAKTDDELFSLSKIIRLKTVDCALRILCALPQYSYEAREIVFDYLTLAKSLIKTDMRNFYYTEEYKNSLKSFMDYKKNELTQEQLDNVVCHLHGHYRDILGFATGGTAETSRKASETINGWQSLRSVLGGKLGDICDNTDNRSFEDMIDLNKKYKVACGQDVMLAGFDTVHNMVLGFRDIGNFWVEDRWDVSTGKSCLSSDRSFDLVKDPKKKEHLSGWFIIYKSGRINGPWENKEIALYDEPLESIFAIKYFDFDDVEEGEGLNDKD